MVLPIPSIIFGFYTLLFVIVFLLCLMLGNQLGLNIIGHEFVTGELGGKRGTSAGKTTQRNRVVGELLQWNLGLEFLVTSL